MTISLSDNLFANLGTTANKSAASKKTQTAGQTDDNSSPFASELDDNTQALAQKNSVDDAANDFSKALAKKTEAKKTSEQTDTDDNSQEKDENTENTAVSQELLAIPAAQNINIDTNRDTVSQEQPAADDSVRIVADIIQTPAISQTVQETNIQEITAPTDEQTQVTEQSISEIISDNLQTAVTDETAVSENENKNEIELTSTAVENLTDISEQTQTEEIEDTEPQLTIEELTADENATNVNAEMPEVEIPVVAAVAQNQQISDQKTDSEEDSDSDINIDVESDTTLKDILSEIQNTIPDSTENSNTTSISADSVNDDKFGLDDSSVKSIEQDTNSSQQSLDIQDGSVETKTSDSNANDNSILTSMQSLATDDLQISKTSANTNSISNVDSTTSVAGQIQYNIQSSLITNNQEIVIQLNPPELGKVEIKFTEDSTGLSGVLSVDKPLTKYEIQQSLPEIIQNLKDGGVDIKKIEVVLANQQEQQTMKDNSSAGQNNWSWQQNSSQQQSNSGGNVYTQWNSKSNEGYNQYSEPTMHYSEDSVNMLV
jgi:hypothetical protein